MEMVKSNNNSMRVESLNNKFATAKNDEQSFFTHAKVFVTLPLTLRHNF